MYFIISRIGKGFTPTMMKIRVVNISGKSLIPKTILSGEGTTGEILDNLLSSKPQFGSLLLKIRDSSSAFITFLQLFNLFTYVSVFLMRNVFLKFSENLCFVRYNDELSQVFMSCNLMGGMFQRLEKMNKNAFASAMLFGENNNSSIAGRWHHGG